MDNALAQKSCLSFMVGLDFVEQAMTKIVQQYVDIWADRWKGRR